MKGRYYWHLMGRGPPPLPQAHSAHRPGPDPGVVRLTRPPCWQRAQLGCPCLMQPQYPGHPSCPHKETPGAAGSHSSSRCPSFLPGPAQRSQEQPVAGTPASPADRPACPTWLQDGESCPVLPGSHHPRCLPGARPCFQPSVEVDPRPVLTRTHAVSGMHEHTSKWMCIHTCTSTPMHPLTAPTPEATKVPILHTAPHRCAPFHTHTGTHGLHWAHTPEARN